MVGEGLEERVIYPQLANEAAAVSGFLSQLGMSLNVAAECIIAIYCQERIIATGSLAGAKLCSIAVDPDYRGMGLAARVVSRLVQEAGRRGRHRYLINTDLATEDIFLSLGFNTVAYESAGVLMAMGPEME